MKTEEEIRQFNIAKQFMEAHPEFNADIQNHDLMLDWMEMRDMKMTLEGLEIAYKAVFCGEPEPKVMSPDLFFQKVTPTKYVPDIAHNIYDLSKFAINPWKPMSTGLAGSNTAIGSITVPQDYLTGLLGEAIASAQLIADASSDSWEWEDLKPPKKPVAPVASECYSEDLVPVQTGRRIKDDD